MRIHWSLWVLALIFVPIFIAGAAGRGAALAWFVSSAIIVVVWIASCRSLKQNAVAQQRRDTDAVKTQHEQQVGDFLDQDMAPIETPGVTLRSGENCYFTSPCLQVQSVKQTTRVGAYGGPSFRVAKGVYWRTGGFASRAVSATHPDVTDRGTAYLTDQRVLFVGGDGVKEYRYDHIAAYEAFQDGFRLDVPNRKPVFYLTEQPSLLGVAFERVRAGIFVGQKSIANVASKACDSQTDPGTARPHT